MNLNDQNEYLQKLRTDPAMHYIKPEEFPDVPIWELVRKPKRAVAAKMLIDYLNTFFPEVVVKDIRWRRNTAGDVFYVDFVDYPEIRPIYAWLQMKDVCFELTKRDYYQHCDKDLALQLDFKSRNPNGVKYFMLSKPQELSVPFVRKYLDTYLEELTNGIPMRTGLSTELMLFDDLRDVFPNETIRHGERPIVRESTGGKLELDIWLKDRKVAIEIQGASHFEHSNWHGTFDGVRKRDEEKRQWCEDFGIQLLRLEWQAFSKHLWSMTPDQRKPMTRKIFMSLMSRCDQCIDVFEDDLVQLMR